MSASTWFARAKGRIDTRQASPSSSARSWIGVDFSGDLNTRGTHRLLPLLALALVVALGVAALRIDLIRIRYAMAAVMKEEEALLDQQRKLIVRRRQLRDPVELAIQARARGFRPPAAIIFIPEPAPWRRDTSARVQDRKTHQLPSVASAATGKDLWR